jgi:hypothetical protein
MCDGSEPPIDDQGYNADVAGKGKGKMAMPVVSLEVLKAERQYSDL